MSVDRFVSGVLSTHATGVQVSASLWATACPFRPGRLAAREAKSHPSNTAYLVPAGLRAVALSRENPGYVLSGLSALAVYGLQFFVDSCDTTMIGPVRATLPGGPTSARVKRKDQIVAWTVNWQGLKVPATPPASALIEAIQDIRAGVHTWEVPTWVGDDVAFRTISLIDACRRHLGITPDTIRSAARGKVSRRWLEKILSMTSGCADSPKETEMRLMCLVTLHGPGWLPIPLLGSTFLDPVAEAMIEASERLSGLGLELAEQVPARRNGKIITVFDLAIISLGIGLMYDGEHHLDRAQRDKDAKITLECTLMSLLPLRFSAGTLEDLPWVVLEAVLARVDQGGA